VVVVVLTSGYLAERGLRDRITENLEQSLEERAKIAQLLVKGIEFSDENRARLNAIAESAGRVAGARVTLIASDGQVLGDSEVPLAQLTEVENHGDRPEVRAALSGRVGHSTRHSQTVRRDMLYLAVPNAALASGPSGRTSQATARIDGVVRLAADLGQIEAAAAELRGELFAAGAIGLLAAVGLSFALSWLSLRPIEELREVVSDISQGRLERRLRWETRDERGEIAASINRMARQMRERESQATREKEQLEAVLASMVEGVLVLDHAGHVVLANPRFREMLGAWGEVEGRLVAEVVRFPSIERALDEARGAARQLAYELDIVSDTNQDVVLLMHAAGFPASGPRVGTVAVFHDVTELRRVDRVRRDFIANASHELRTPLTAIQGFADTLTTSPLDHETMMPYLEVIARNAQRMSDLIDDLLTLSRIEGEHVNLDLQAIDVVRIAEVLLADFEPRFQKEELSVELHAGDIPACRADRGALEQILTNLLTNAVRYNDPGGRIDVHIEDAGERIEVRVEDTGIGIPEAELERIFERFYRVDAARSKAVGSTGLGLSIVKHLVIALGGEIRVESKPGIGSKFRFTLPKA
jgi:two-component system phosphate regulon sensor histidine kinase PhoR